jgi:hypothetical protein
LSEIILKKDRFDAEFRGNHIHTEISEEQKRISRTFLTAISQDKEDPLSNSASAVLERCQAGGQKRGE